MTDDKAAVPQWSARLGTDEFSIDEAIGGVRGAVESLLPGLVFVVAYVVTKGLWWPVGLSAGVSIVFVILRLVQRTPLTQALAGLIGVVIGIIWAASSGKAENYYAWGLLTNAIYGAAIALSIIVRQPLGGWAVKFLWSLPPEWTREEQFQLLYRRAVMVTWVWMGLFVLRLAVQAPLYFGGQVAALGIAKLLLGLPLFGVAAWLTWVLLRHQRPASDPDTAPTTDS